MTKPSKKSAPETPATDTVETATEPRFEVGDLLDPDAFRQKLTDSGRPALLVGNAQGCHVAHVLLAQREKHKDEKDHPSNVLLHKKAGEILAASAGILWTIVNMNIEQAIDLIEAEEVPEDLRLIGLNLAANQLMTLAAFDHAIKDLCDDLAENKSFNENQRKGLVDFAKRIDAAGAKLAETHSRCRGTTH